MSYSSMKIPGMGFVHLAFIKIGRIIMWAVVERDSDTPGDNYRQYYYQDFFNVS